MACRLLSSNFLSHSSILHDAFFSRTIYVVFTSLFNLSSERGSTRLQWLLELWEVSAKERVGQDEEADEWARGADHWSYLVRMM